MSKEPKAAIDPDTTAVTTTRNMADAVSYLARVASEAGLRNIAVRLNGIRTSLLISARRQAEEAGAGESKFLGVNRGLHEKRKLS